LDTVTISLGVEGVVCEEQDGRVNIYIALYCILQGFGVLSPRLLILQDLENSQALLRTLASAHMPVVAFPSSSWCLKKRGKASEKYERNNYG
jgi:hypothetical protein